MIGTFDSGIFGSGIFDNPIPPASHKAPFWLPQTQTYSNLRLIDSHTHVLYSLGEYCLFILMWHVDDFKAGRVGRCTTCYTTRARASEAYKQSDDGSCPNCYGTSFEGGFRAQVIRPTLVSDRSTDTVPERHGEVITDTVSLETTTDFSTHTGDYVVRAEGTRYRMEEMGTLVVRSGFDLPYQSESVGGLIPSAKLENPSSVAYLISPLATEINELLFSLAVDRQTPRDVTAWDVRHGPLIV